MTSSNSSQLKPRKRAKKSQKLESPASASRQPLRTVKNKAQIGIGAHVSVAGGYCEALKRAAEQDFDALQMFTSSPRSRVRREIKKEEEQEFLKQACVTPVRNVYVHTPYYVNAASPDSRTWHFSKSYILRELELMDRINARYFVMHVGSHTGAGPEIGKERVVRMLTEVLAESPKSNVTVCLENTAGQGNEVGSSLEDLGEVLHPFRKNKRIGAVIDTCHIFSAGYDIRTPEEVARTFKLVDKWVGWDRIPMLHFNDSKVGLGGHRDRHEHLGKGHIGLKGLAAVINSPFLHGKDLILETEPEGRAPDIAWLKKTVAKVK